MVGTTLTKSAQELENKEKVRQQAILSPYGSCRQPYAPNVKLLKNDVPDERALSGHYWSAGWGACHDLTRHVPD
jgi:hypothetical protein